MNKISNFPHFLSTIPMAVTLSPSFLHTSFSRGPLSRLTLGRRRIVSLAAVSQGTTAWTSAPLSLMEPAAVDLYHVTIDVSAEANLANSHSRAGQYLQIRVPGVEKPAYMSIASPPSLSVTGFFEFLVESVPGSTAEAICRLRKGDTVEITPATGNGFAVERISPAADFQSVLMFATGAGISPIRSLIENGFDAEIRSDVRLYYGARNLESMAYQDRFKAWEASGVKVIPVLSQPDENWAGEKGYVQEAFSKNKNIANPKGTGAVLCGQKQMMTDVTSMLIAEGISADKILTNF